MIKSRGKLRVNDIGSARPPSPLWDSSVHYPSRFMTAWPHPTALHGRKHLYRGLQPIAANITL
jgi:hypothetical protein